MRVGSALQSSSEPRAVFLVEVREQGGANRVAVVDPNRVENHAVPQHHIPRLARHLEAVRVLGKERAPRDVRLRQRVRYRRVRAATRGAGLELAARLG